MGIISTITQIERKFAWSFLGFILAAIFGGIALYTEFFRDVSPSIRYQIISNTRILDVKEDIGGLSIIYNNEDIRQARKTLSVLAIKVSNEGRSAILKNYYDSASPLGFLINSGQIIKGEVISATTPYLRENAKIVLIDNKTVEFSQVIVEPRESFAMKFLILNPENTPLLVTPKGKVAGVKQIALVDQLMDEKEASFLYKVVSGSIWIQISRVPIYFFGFILSLIIIVAPFALISSMLDERRKKKIVKQFKTHTSSKYDETNKALYDYYINNNLRTLLRLRKILVNDDRFSRAMITYKRLSADSGEIAKPQFNGISSGPSHYRDRNDYSFYIFKSLIDLGLISQDGDGYQKNDQKMLAMNEFIEFVLIKEA
ncbi:MAG: hypothetical protein HZA11_10570 [Nitrospirae bacterium]|nr:hypothetical protein [Nitrospirota bacterium]